MRMWRPISDVGCLLILAAFVPAALDIDNDENENYMKIICHVQHKVIIFAQVASNATTSTASSSNSNNICVMDLFYLLNA
uniref:Secreted protein n=1 Tax=Glossina palpalis gambiensis TaxID=67801 RepID=A0A1B0APY6_9MUSC